MVRFRLSNIGKKKPKLSLEIWNGEIRFQSMQIRVGVSIEALEDLENQIKKIKEEI